MEERRDLHVKPVFWLLCLPSTFIPRNIIICPIPDSRGRPWDSLTRRSAGLGRPALGVAASQHDPGTHAVALHEPALSPGLAGCCVSRLGWAEAGIRGPSRSGRPGGLASPASWKGQAVP